MACLFSAAVRLLLLGLFLSTEPASSVGDFEKVSVSSGETATLPCSAPYSINDFRKITVEWTKPGLEDSYVLVFPDGRLDPDEQDSSYKSRVELAEPELKNRNLSMILKDVTEKDEGRYECFFNQAAARKKRAAPKPIKTIDLEVKEKHGDDKKEGGFNEGGRAWIITGIVFGFMVLVLVGVVVFFVLPKIKKRVLNFRKNTEGTDEKQDEDLEKASLSGSGPGPGSGPG